MPTPLKHSSNMRKHLTKTERESRERAEAGLVSERQAYLRAPAWLSKEARVVFQNTKRRLRHYDLLEVVDIDLLALYADAVARYQAAVKDLTPAAEVKTIQAAQAWSRISLAYADKLGFSQTARARLARKKAQAEPVDPLEQLLGGVIDDVTDFVNGEGNS